MRFQSPSNSAAVAAVGLVLAVAAGGTAVTSALGQPVDLSVLDLPPRAISSAVVQASGEFQLKVFVNGDTRSLIAAVHVEEDGSLSMDSTQLYNVGILPASSARQPNGRINLGRLPGVEYLYDAPAQELHFTAAEEMRAPLLLSAGSGSKPLDLSDPRNEVSTGFGGLINYALHASSLYEVEASQFYSSGVTGTLEGRLFSPVGVFENSVRFLNDDFRRLNTNFTWSEPSSMHTVRAGDLITSGLSWTRPTRLAGIQFQKNFALRPGLITMPVPGFTGSAAVPSTVDVFLNNARRFSTDVASGPFEVADLPVVTGPGTAQVVVRDEFGNEHVTESSYFVSDRLLRPGLLDYSFELGFPRTGFGTAFDQYDERLFAATSIRYGLSDWLTWEGHAEGGEDLLNGGMSFVSGLGSWGVGSLAVAGSRSGDDEGVQLTAGLEFALGDVRLQGRLQQSFGTYHDIASVTLEEQRKANGMPSNWGAPTRSFAQVSASMPVLDFGSLNLSYTHREDIWGDEDRLLGVSYAQPFSSGTLSASAFSDVERDNWGLFASFSIPIGENRRASTSTRSTDDGVGIVASVSQSPNADNGEFGWQVQYEQREEPRASARGTLDTDIASFGGSLRGSQDAVSGSASVSGAIVAAGGGLFLSQRIDDAFAIVDAGAAGVEVFYENRPAGFTGSNGLFLVPDLRSYERNRVGIDPANMPLDAVVSSSRQTVIPADRTGVVVTFADASSNNALVTFRDAEGAFVEVGSLLTLAGGPDPFIVGYDGQAFLTGLGERNRVSIQQPSGHGCEADFTFTASAGDQVTLLDAVCLPGRGDAS